MNYYTATIPPTLAEKLKERGMPMMTNVSISIVEDKPVVDDNGEQWYRPTYAEVFDWLMEKGIMITIRAVYYLNGELGGWQPHYNHWGLKKCDSWHEAANAAIEKAITLI